MVYYAAKKLAEIDYTMHATNRKGFLAAMAAAGAAAALPRRVFADSANEIRAMLLHLGHNMSLIIYFKLTFHREKSSI